MTEVPAAREVRLRKLTPLAPPFHRHIARSALIGKEWAAGDRVVVYEIVSTVPGGRVTVTEETVLHFD